MCGSLKHEGQSDFLGKGELFPVVLQNGQRVEAMWDGFARVEGIDDWHKHGWQAGDVVGIDQYTEGYRPPRTYDIPKGYALKCVTRLIPSKGYVMKIETRPAVEKEQAVHDRFPILTKRRY